MGLIDFVKNAGSKIFGKEDEKQSSSASDRAVIDARRAAALRGGIGHLGLEVEDLEIEVKGDLATVRGKVATQAAREKVVLVVGNTAGIARVDDRLEVEKQEPEAQLHTVAKGETLSKIAKQYYGNAMKYPVIFEANKPMLTDPDKIYPGQVLRIPALEEASN
ncbi:MAG: peptidoglycan-binding protein LysM [Acidobacteria bacterium]|nr:MAG: peptidoglycan-binding protein LysM [Acidobacteriota bacterium]REK08309.1 MAG: peptidoglycan-binding protein LysM [Acidobacteriota bacterium]